MLANLVTTMTKIGARHGRKDKESLQKAHDCVAALVDCAHCMTAAADVEKAGARHSKADTGKIKAVHDMLCDLGATCPDSKETAKV